MGIPLVGFHHSAGPEIGKPAFTTLRVVAFLCTFAELLQSERTLIAKRSSTNFESFSLAKHPKVASVLQQQKVSEDRVGHKQHDAAVGVGHPVLSGDGQACPGGAGEEQGGGELGPGDQRQGGGPLSKWNQLL